MTKKLKKPAFHEIVVEDLAYGGRGIARQDGLVWFIDGAIPGQKVRVRIRKKRKRRMIDKGLRFLISPRSQHQRRRHDLSRVQC